MNYNQRVFSECGNVCVMWRIVVHSRNYSLLTVSVPGKDFSAPVTLTMKHKVFMVSRKTSEDAQVPFCSSQQWESYITLFLSAQTNLSISSYLSQVGSTRGRSVGQHTHRVCRRGNYGVRYIAQGQLILPYTSARPALQPQTCFLTIRLLLPCAHHAKA